MVGDWVLYGEKPRQVRYINDRVWWDGSCHNDEIGFTHHENEWIAAHNAKPISLTPEILKKNGFSPETFLTSEWEKEVYFKEFPGCVVEPDNSGKYIFGTTIYWNKKDGDGSPIDWGTMYESRIHNLQYVHELQNALRLCGLNELADNFKV